VSATIKHGDTSQTRTVALLQAESTRLVGAALEAVLAYRDQTNADARTAQLKDGDSKVFTHYRQRTIPLQCADLSADAQMAMPYVLEFSTDVEVDRSRDGAVKKTVDVASMMAKYHLGVRSADLVNDVAHKLTSRATLAVHDFCQRGTMGDAGALVKGGHSYVYHDNLCLSVRFFNVKDEQFVQALDKYFGLLLEQSQFSIAKEFLKATEANVLKTLLAFLFIKDDLESICAKGGVVRNGIFLALGKTLVVDQRPVEADVLERVKLADLQVGNMERLMTDPVFRVYVNEAKLFNKVAGLTGSAGFNTVGLKPFVDLACAQYVALYVSQYNPRNGELNVHSTTRALEMALKETMESVVHHADFYEGKYYGCRVKTNMAHAQISECITSLPRMRSADLHNQVYLKGIFEECSTMFHLGMYVQRNVDSRLAGAMACLDGDQVPREFFHTWEGMLVE